MAILGSITAIEVFDFMGVNDSIRTEQTGMIESLIANMGDQFIHSTGRQIETQTSTDLLLQDQHNCVINCNELLLLPPFTDFYDITSLKEFGSDLNLVIAYNDNNDYLYDNGGKITRVLGSWSRVDASIQISGKYGFVNTSDDTIRNDVKQIIIEMVASKSGLWKVNVADEDGSIQIVRTTISTDTKKRLDQMRLLF